MGKLFNVLVLVTLLYVMTETIINTTVYILINTNVMIGGGYLLLISFILMLISDKILYLNFFKK